MSEKLTIKQCLDYEVRTHWLASWIWFEWGQRLMGSYIAGKVSRKYKRYSWSILMAERVNNLTSAITFVRNPDDVEPPVIIKIDKDGLTTGD